MVAIGSRGSFSSLRPSYNSAAMGMSEGIEPRSSWSAFDTYFYPKVVLTKQRRAECGTSRRQHSEKNKLKEETEKAKKTLGE